MEYDRHRDSDVIVVPARVPARAGSVPARAEGAGYYGPVALAAAVAESPCLSDVTSDGPRAAGGGPGVAAAALLIY